MRSIGKKNIKLVKETVHDELRKRFGSFESMSYSEVTEKVIDRLPVKLWDTWESADTEIRNLIDDELTAFAHGELKL